MTQTAVNTIIDAGKEWELSTTQLGAISETLIAAQLMLVSDGRFSTFTPQADDDGIDLILLDKETRKTIPIQIKAAFMAKDRPRSTVQFDTRLKTFRKLEGTYVLCLAIDRQSAAINWLWLIPTRELASVSNATATKLAIAPSTKPNSKDRYTPYRFDSIGKVIEKLVEDGRIV